MTSSQSTWRILAYRFLVAIFVIGLITSTTAIWANVRVKDSDAWADTVGPLASDAAVQEFVLDQASTLIGQQIAADDEAGRLQDFSRSQITSLVNMALADFVSSPTFATWWTEANRTTHAVVTRIMDDEQGQFIQTHDGDLVLDLQPAVDWVNTHLETLFPRLSYRINLPVEQTVIVLYSSDALASATRVLEIIDTLAIVLPVVTLIAFSGALIIANDRMAALKQTGLATGISIAILLIALTAGRTWFIARQEAALRDFLDAGIRIVLADLLVALRLFALAGIALAGVVTAGRSKYARDPRVQAFMREHRQLIAGGVLGGAILALILTDYPPMWLSIGALILIVASGYLLLRWRKEAVYAVTTDERSAKTS